jgi:hypothetical protein
MPIGKVILNVLVLATAVSAQSDATPPRDTFENTRVAHPYKSDLVGGDAVRAVSLDRVWSGPPGSVIVPRSAANDCSDVLDGGVLPIAGGVLPGNTYLAGNDFEDVFDPGCGYQYPHGSGHDEIWEFQVEGDGRWTFDTCTIPAGWDTSLGLYEDIVIECPGRPVTCNGDDPCGYYYESAIRDVCLQAGNTYWLVVDGWSPTYAFPGSYYDVTYSRTVDPCLGDADCDDGDMCTGIDTCVDGCCVVGAVPCERWETCIPETQTCVNEHDPCHAWYTDQTLHGSFSPQCYNGCTGSYTADDIQLHPDTGHELISYQIYTQARNVMDAYPECTDPEPQGMLYDISTDLFTVVSGDINGVGCRPDAIIDGAGCFFERTGVCPLPGGCDPYISVCEPAGGLPTGITLPTGTESHTDGQCGVDFYIGVISHAQGAGVSLPTNNQEQFLGGPALDDEFGQSVIMFENCTEPAPGTPLGTWSPRAFSAPIVSDARGAIVCTVPTCPCCFPTGGCEMLSQAECDARGGQIPWIPWLPRRCGDPGADPDGDGVYLVCDNCPYDPNPAQRDCNDDGVGDACEDDPGEQDNDNDGCCDDVDECDDDPAKCDAGQCGCGEDDLDSDGDCDSGVEGCAGHCMDCVDECNNDPEACVLDDFCGCPAYPFDWDGDGVPNCEDQCPGVDDAIFGPGEGRASSCVSAIPTVSAWGLLILALLLLVVGKVYFGRRERLYFVLCVLVLPGVALAQTDAAPPRDPCEKSRAGHLQKSDFVLGDAVRAAPLHRAWPEPRGSGTTPRSSANDCSAVLAAGVLPTVGGYLSGDTYLAGNDFSGVFDPDCGYQYPYGSGHDEIWEFTVEANGRWTFDTCTIPAGWDTSLGLYRDIEIGCPGLPMICNGDDPCSSYTCGEDGDDFCYESAIRDVCLQTGNTYWLVVDGWSPTYAFAGGAYDVTYSRTEDPCTTDAECDDGDICNGLERCELGCCVVGPSGCERWETCIPETQTCVNEHDPCHAWYTDQTLTGSFSPQCYNGCTGSLIAEDIQLHPGMGHELISYQVYTQARNVMGAYPECDEPEPLGSPYDITTELWTAGDWGLCMPYDQIPGTRCDLTEVGVVMESGSPADVSVCEPNGGLPTGIVLPTGDEDPVDGQCGVDFYLGLISWNDGAGASLASWGTEQVLGGPALDDEFGQSVVAWEDCVDGVPHGSWGAGCDPGPCLVGDMRGVIVCTVPSGPCCFPTGGCEMLSEFDCADQGGTLVGLTDPSNPLSCEDDDGDPDDDGIYFTCDNCPDLANPDQRDCNDDGEGDACEASPDEHDDDNDGACNGIDPCPLDPEKSEPGTGLGQAPGQCGCGVRDVDSDYDGTANCIDRCPLDPYRIIPEPCRCNTPPEGNEDDDGDGFENCIDTCPGVDDAVFGPCGPDLIPTVSSWGLLTLALSLLAIAKICFTRRRQRVHT